MGRRRPSWSRKEEGGWISETRKKGLRENQVLTWSHGFPIPRTVNTVSHTPDYVTCADLMTAPHPGLRMEDHCQGNLMPPQYEKEAAHSSNLMAESKEELKSLLMKMKEESKKVGLKLNIQKMKIMASGPITSWQIDGETVDTVADFIFLGSKITADGDCSHEIKRHLLLGRKVMTNLDSILKSRDITLPTKVRLVMAMVFPVVMYGCK
uniref:Reverse transcriptase domain-containing protein n=1 Tax=Bos indicus x Bos taurus TaxID=30522 RepID=A0A4W2CA38_BOBOX